MQYTTLEQIEHAVADSDRDVQVVLMPGNDRCSIWPKGHPCGFAEDHPASITVPAGMNGHTAEFLREELNARNGWAVTGDQQEDPGEWFDFAIQAELALEPKEGLHHQVWVQLRALGECTSAQMAQLTGRDKMQCRRALSRMYQNGNAKRWFIDDKTAVYSATDLEPPFEAKPNQNDKEATAQIYRDMDAIMQMLEEGQLTANDLAELTGLTRKRVSSMLHKMKSMGAVKCVKAANRHYYWESTE